MDVSINRFVFLLKRNGVRISPSESIDAMQALACVGSGRPWHGAGPCCAAR